MKKKGLLITTIVLFLIVNTTYYWEGKLGFFEFLPFIFIACFYIGLLIIFFIQLIKVIKEKLADKQRFYVLALLGFVLTLTFFRPFGFIDFEKFEGKNLFIAEREGAANCFTRLQLKEDLTFKEKNICFGISEISGNYRFRNDTIYFESVKLGRQEDHFYEFAVIRPTKFNNDKIIADMIRYKDKTDTIGHFLWVTKNELDKLKSIR